VFIELLKKHIAAFWSDGSNVADMGRVVNTSHHNRLCDLFTDIDPSQIVCGNPNVLQDRDLKPSVVLNPAQDSRLMKDEIFGPILPLITYIEFDEVVKYINTMEKPLAIYYFGSSSGSNYKRLEKETSSGALVNNDVLFQAFNSDLPFGGVGHSGYGRYHGVEGFKAFSNPKSILIKPALTMYPYN
jgi:acyl-CoA reductase-like NAD-dependent aldehyde dehydrogenase